MKRQQAAGLALVIEVASWLIQRARGHSATCMCSECALINLSIPVTLTIALPDEK